MLTHETRIAVRYAETDAMAVVHHASYIVWFEVARTEWLQSRGYSYAEFEKTGYFLVVAEVQARYLQPARYGDEVIVTSWPAEMKSRALRFAYEVRHAVTGALLVTAQTRHILTDHQGNVRTFPAFMTALMTENPS